MPSRTITVRVPDKIYNRLPRALLKGGKRSAFVLQAIVEKMDRDKKGGKE